MSKSKGCLALNQDYMSELSDISCLRAGRWFSPCFSVSSTNNTDCHDITEILLKVALNTITPYFVLQLANRLKKFDPEKQQVGEDSEDPMWLQHLQRINQGFEVCLP